MLFYCKKYKYRATFSVAKAKEKSVSKKKITNCGNGVEVILKSGKQKYAAIYRWPVKKEFSSDTSGIEYLH